MICPVMKITNTAPPCKADGGGKGTACAWWDHTREQCSIKTIAGALEGILAALFEFNKSNEGGDLDGEE